MTSAIVIVVFEITHFLEKQIHNFGTLCESDDVIVVDSSKNLEWCHPIAKICKKKGAEYTKFTFPDNDPSVSHGAACNFAYARYAPEYDLMFFVDHDLIPVSVFDWESFMDGKAIAGVPHVKNYEGVDYYYFWPGCAVINNLIVDKELVGFEPIGLHKNNLRLDTGGPTYRIIEKFPDQYAFFSERQVNFNEDTSGKYPFYANILDGTFLHMINGSNWNNEPEEEYNERVNKFLELVENVRV